MEQLDTLAPAPAGETPSVSQLDPSSPADLNRLTAGHLDSAFDALAAILKSPQARAAGSRPYEALRDALKQIDRYYPVVTSLGTSLTDGFATPEYRVSPEEPALETERLTPSETGLA